MRDLIWDIIDYDVAIRISGVGASLNPQQFLLPAIGAAASTPGILIPLAAAAAEASWPTKQNTRLPGSAKIAKSATFLTAGGGQELALATLGRHLG